MFLFWLDGGNFTELYIKPIVYQSNLAILKLLQLKDLKIILDKGEFLKY